MAITLEVILSTGLITCYAVLTYNTCKYYYSKMKKEMKRLTILFASFVISYGGNMIYVILRGNSQGGLLKASTY